MNKKMIILAALAVAGTLVFYYFKSKKQSGGSLLDFSTLLQPTTTTQPKTDPAQTTQSNSANQSVIAGTKGYLAYPKGTSVNVRSEASTASTVITNVPNGKAAGTTTGLTAWKSDGVWYQITLPIGYGWVRNDVVELIPTTNPTIQSWLPAIF